VGGGEKRKVAREHDLPVRRIEAGGEDSVVGEEKGKKRKKRMDSVRHYKNLTTMVWKKGRTSLLTLPLIRGRGKL